MQGELSGTTGELADVRRHHNEALQRLHEQSEALLYALNHHKTKGHDETAVEQVWIYLSSLVFIPLVFHPNEAQVNKLPPKRTCRALLYKVESSRSQKSGLNCYFEVSPDTPGDLNHGHESYTCTIVTSSQQIDRCNSQIHVHLWSHLNGTLLSRDWCTVCQLYFPSSVHHLLPSWFRCKLSLRQRSGS